MPISKSSNCSKYTDAVSTLISVESTTADGCAVEKAMFSCQKHQFERPDSVSENELRMRSENELIAQGCDVDTVSHNFSSNIMGARTTEYSASRLSALGMTSNCSQVGNDPNQATHKVSARCKPMYDMLDENGNSVRNYNMTILAGLAACDVSEEAMPQVYEDVQKVAVLNAAHKGYTVERPEHLACEFSVLPHI